mmetsp:Transcript_150/g.342  ORF Transcript_150/g.342 Transcript_150/m.342 type:complete len:347 (-) Transcript_150:399-1439(-)|eukprot:CAMPEP_0172529706 /NCGR_PEP_ID=MMETSP1067-20121228/3716_1 /TAXON_ID=265564 ORGANISM="Thalassiosira punctigera, Strain Tpunct2005C2" /NCGR_SAMPLE_ID=MMETSP1067 /ASSEMBLY_ACC=CAM_ASM_000444 /LENGTH=346 /DNA_ID=CAMNT_0013313811 /DNA_START=164 /DNA_END=1204 /DNA_ORIENTATION=-
MVTARFVLALFAAAAARMPVTATSNVAFVTTQNLLSSPPRESNAPRETSTEAAPPRYAPMPPLAMSKSSDYTLQQQIIQGATLKLLQKETYKSPVPRNVQTKSLARETSDTAEGQFTYYVREGHRSEIKQIADVLMDSFHHDSQRAFDSYIRRYKYNHLLMCFDGIDCRDRGLFVACAVPTSLEEGGKERIVGFCSVDGRAPDPSCKIEFLTPSTLAGTSPRPYLSDLGVCVAHQRRGVGEKLVRECEEWTNERGYERLYLKVEKENLGGIGLYSALGYTKTKLPWGRDVGSDRRWDTTVLLEKSLNDSIQKEKRKRRWIKNQVWKPLKSGVDRYSARVNNGPPPI